jgi:Cyclic phosphodiesterase-like protein
MDSPVACEHSFWLVPAEPMKNRLRALISSLAGRFSAVEFDPHVTVWCGVSDDARSREMAAVLARRFSPIELTPTILECTEEYTKTLFIKFGHSAYACEMFEALQRRQSPPSTYKFDPHLSLMYKSLPLDSKRKIRESLEVPSGTYRFDQLRIIEVEIPLTQDEQVRNWRTVFDISLRPEVWTAAQGGSS